MLLFRLGSIVYLCVDNSFSGNHDVCQATELDRNTEHLNSLSSVPRRVGSRFSQMRKYSVFLSSFAGDKLPYPSRTLSRCAGRGLVRLECAGDVVQIRFLESASKREAHHVRESYLMGSGGERRVPDTRWERWLHSNLRRAGGRLRDFKPHKGICTSLNQPSAVRNPSFFFRPCHQTDRISSGRRNV